MRQLGKLRCLEVNNNDEAPWVVLFHGYGADAEDLFSLHEMIPVKGEVNWLFPQGPLEVPIGPGWTGRAWWSIDMLAIQQLAARGETRDMSQECPPGLKNSAVKAFEALKQLGVPWNRVILGGFSQGAMLATELFLNAPEPPAGLVLFSGTLLNEPEWKEKAAARKGAQYFMSHGEQDPVLGIKQARRLESLLSMSGMKGNLVSFSGGHEIPPVVIVKSGEYITRQLVAISK